MSERKVLSKYYPPSFDPSKISRTPRHLRPTGPKTITVRLMAPFSMKCTRCGEYIYKGRKFNARKESSDEKYLNIAIYRFYIRCTRCSGEIRFKTDPKNMDYVCESGALRSFEPWRESKEGLEETDEQRLDRLEREEAEEDELKERNAMEELEGKMQDSKREMQIADALDEIRTRNARIERGERGGGSEVALTTVQDRVDEDKLKADQEDEEAVKRAFTADNVERVIREAEEEEQKLMATRLTTNTTSDGKQAPLPTFERVKKAKKPLVPGLVKKVEPVKSAPTPPASTMGLVDYDSD